MLQVDDEDEDDDDPNKTYDLIILGLPWKTSEDDIREYFEVSVCISNFAMWTSLMIFST